MDPLESVICQLLFVDSLSFDTEQFVHDSLFTIHLRVRICTDMFVRVFGTLILAKRLATFGATMFVGGSCTL
jgi:hypothetical protein